MPENYNSLSASNGGPARGEVSPPEDAETYSLRRFFIYLGLMIYLFFLWLGFVLFQPSYSPPDLGDYVDLQTLNATFLDLNNPDRRVIMVGDLHGMMHSLNNLLDKLHYNATTDLLIHLGDIVAKGPHSDEMVSRFASSNVLGVRGNNDQKVIEWYGWFEWVRSQHNGGLWLDSLLERNITGKQAKGMGMWKSLRYTYPKSWEWNGDHFNVARRLNASDYAYLAARPIVIHLPILHTFMVHGGLLPTDPSHHLRSRIQPLANGPELPENPTLEDIEAARYKQEVAVLTEIEPNTDPYVKLNIRDVHDLQPTRRGPADHEDNEPWSELWNRVIKRCHGFGALRGLSSATTRDQITVKKPLPCYPMTVVYSHASGRGLDLKKWSKGVDTGCVNGNGLTALVLGEGRHKHLMGQRPFVGADDDERDMEIPFGDDDRGARLVSVSCPEPPSD